MMVRMTDAACWMKDDGEDREDNEDSGAMMMQIYISVTVFMCPRTHTHTFSINYILQTNRSVCRDELASLLGSTWNSNFEQVALPHTSFAL